MKPTTLDNNYANQRPFKGFSVGTIIAILVVGLILLSLSAQAKSTKESQMPLPTSQVEGVTQGGLFVC